MMLESFEQSLQAATSIIQVDHALGAYLKSWGFSGYTFSYYAPITSKENKLRHEVCSERLRTWHDYYFEERFDVIDQTQSEVLKATLPLYWDTQQQLLDAKTDKDRKIREETLALGITCGLSIPIHGPGSDYAELTLRQFQEENCLMSWQKNKYEWQLAALYYFNYMKRYLVVDNPLNVEAHLTEREQQCLNLLVEKHSVLEIAHKLAITERTVNFHIQNINHKLGVRNKYQAVAKVGAAAL